MKTRTRGFTLIEVLIVVVIIGILTAIAIPSYTQYMRRAARHQAEATMLNLSQMEERYYTNNYTYYAVTTPAPTPEPNGWSNFSGDGMGARKYDIIVNITANPLPDTYTIQASTSNGFIDPDCVLLKLTNLGVKTSTPGSVSTCW
jgi:type IV pilus assembly protein PilE